MRVGLAIAILAWHSFGAVYGPDWIAGVPPFIKALLATLLPMFFGLSGFLIMGSAFRTHNVRTFITFRVLRILPALLVEVSLAALVLGPFVTTLPLGQYFTDPQFLKYFGSLIGAIQYLLPGVFVNNPLTTVNGALWTVGPEIVCYCLVAAMMLTGFFVRKGPMITCAVIYLAVCLFTDSFEAQYNMFHLPTKALILSFLSGNIIFLYKDRIKFDVRILLAVIVVSIAAIVASQNAIQLRPLGYLAAILMPYCAAYGGLSNPRPLPFFHRGDYSYGIYIYGFPIQQSLVYFFPGQRTWYFNLGFSLIIATAFAVMSWHLIEKPVLSLRKRLLPKPNELSKDETREGFTVRKLVALGLIAAYGLFVMNASRVFPLKTIYSSMRGQPPAAAVVKQEQF